MERLVKEQLEVLCGHVDREDLDYEFVERHARQLADIARLALELRAESTAVPGGSRSTSSR